MRSSIKENAYAVLFPAFATTSLSNSVQKFLGSGGCSILLGETREEYVARQMSADRRAHESPADFLIVTERARSLAGNVIVAVDQEIGGICRLHELVEQFPGRSELQSIDSIDFARLSEKIAGRAKEMGVNCFLAPILDNVCGENPWLEGRTWSRNPEAIARLSSAFISGIQAKGVAAVAKHFPGYVKMALDPAVEPDAVNEQPIESFESSLNLFAEAIETDVESIMMGPAVVAAFDPHHAASVSPTLVNMLRCQLGFTGLVMSDDLDAAAIMKGVDITEIAVRALNAGCDLLLVGDVGDQVEKIAMALICAVGSGVLDEHRLAEAAIKVRQMAAKYA